MNRRARRSINRSNSRNSTGPISPEGKQASSQNATTHGLNSLKPYIPSEEQAYLAYHKEYMEDHAPASLYERELVELLIDTRWRLKRIPILEARLFVGDDADPSKIIRSLDILSRHQMRLRKLAAETIAMLDNFQQARDMPKKTQTLNGKPKQNGFVSPAKPTRPSGYTAATPREEIDAIIGVGAKSSTPVEPSQMICSELTDADD